MWLADAGSDKVYRYTGAAGRLTGSQSAVARLKLETADSNPKGIVTDGASFWVVDDGTSTDKVYKYTLSGSLRGNWAIDPANAHPTGLTVNPANVSDIWVVDSSTRKVYQYAAAAGRTSGSQAAAATFALAAGNTNPQDIADPPPAADLIPAAAAYLLADPAGTPVPPAGPVAEWAGADCFAADDSDFAPIAVPSPDHRPRRA